MRQIADLFGHRGAEKESLALRWQVGEYATNVGEEAHVTHHVGLVQHQYVDLREIDAAVADVIEQPAGAGDHDLGTALQGRELGPLAHAPIDGDAAHARILAQVNDGLVNLLSKLSRGRDYEGTHLTQRASHKALENGQDERRGLSGACLRQPQYVAPFEHDGDRLPLDRRGPGIAGRANAGEDARV